MSDEGAEKASICNINYLLHLLFIIGVWGIHEETLFIMQGCPLDRQSVIGFAWVRKISNSCRDFRLFTLQYFKIILACNFLLYYCVFYCIDDIEGNTFMNGPSRTLITSLLTQTKYHSLTHSLTPFSYLSFYFMGETYSLQVLKRCVLVRRPTPLGLEARP